jgi:hypothetical protein
VRAFRAFEAKRLFSVPPSPICDRKNAPMTDMQDQIRPTPQRSEDVAKTRYEGGEIAAGNLKWPERVLINPHVRFTP